MSHCCGGFWPNWTPHEPVDKLRIDPQAPGGYGATITFSLPLERQQAEERARRAAIPSRR
jgi:hypothetical protein